MFQDLQLALGQFTANCEMVGSLPKNGGYLEVSFTSEMKMKRDEDDMKTWWAVSAQACEVTIKSRLGP